MRLKDRRRIILVALLLVVLGAGAFAALFVRKWQKENITNRFLEQSRVAFKNGDYFNALVDSGRFIQRSRRDDPRRPDALLIYAESRTKVPEPDGRHLREAANFFGQYIERRDDPEIYLRALKLYNQSGYFVEARDLALRMLPPEIAKVREPGRQPAEVQAALDKADAAQLPVLTELATALLRSKDTGGPLLDLLLQRILVLDPLDVDGNLLRLEYLSGARREADARALGESLLAAHPDDPVACIVAAITPGAGPASEAAARSMGLLCKAAGLDPADAARLREPAYTDPEIAQRLTMVFERINAFDHSFAVIRDAADRLQDPDMQGILIRRLWQEGRYDEIATRLASLDPASPRTDPDMLGFQALAFLSLDRAADARNITAALSKRQGDYRAGAWAKVLSVVGRAPEHNPEDTAKPIEDIETLAAAVKATQAREPVFLTLQGDRLALLGRNDEARQAWASAANSILAASWPVPWLRTAETLLADGRADEAASAASQAMQIAPNRAAVAVVWFEAQAARIQKGSRAEPQAPVVLANLQRLEENLRKRPGSGAADLIEQLLPSKVALIVSSGNRDEARKVALEALAGPSLKVATLQRLAAVSASEHLGVEAECIQRAQQVAGSDINITFTRAMELAAQGKPRDGMSLLEAAAAKSPGDPTIGIAIVRYKEQTGDPTAPAAWATLAAAHPADLAVQRAVLTSPLAATDRKLIEQSIDRYKLIVGDDGGEDPVARTALARALLHGAPSRNERDRAVGLLQSVVAAQPRNADPKVQLAAALTYSDPSKGISPDFARATALLNEASALEPRSVSIRIDLARLLQLQKQFDRARDELSRVASDRSTEPEFRQTAAVMLINQGDVVPTALATLKELAEAQAAAPDPRVLVALAGAYLSQGQEGPAAEIYAKLASGAASDGESIFVTARYYLSRGDSDHAKAAIARLDTLQAPGVKDHVLARLAAEQDQSAEAVRHYSAAAAAAPQRADLWREYLAILFRLAQFEQATAVATTALASVPQDGGIKELREIASALAKSPDPDVTEIVQTLPINTNIAIAQVSELCRAVREAKAKGEFGTAEGLGRLSERYAGFGQFQLFLARRLALLGAEDRAADLVARARAANPADPYTARAAAQLYLGLRRYGDMLSAANEWRLRDPSRSIEADVAVAEAHLRLSQHAQGAQVLAARAQAAAADPEGPMALPVLNIYGQLLIAQGREAAARELLSPRLSSSGNARLVWLALASSHLPLERAVSWIQEVRSAAPAGSAADQLPIVAAYATLSARFPENADAMRGEATAILKALADNPKTASPIVFESLGKMHHAAGRLDEAAAAYRRAIEMDPARTDSLNNLAAILSGQGDAGGALRLAHQAIQASPTPANVDTLAGIYLTRAAARTQGGDKAGAASDFKLAGDAYRRIAAMSPGAAEPLKAAAKCYEEAADASSAMTCYEGILSLPNLSPIDSASAKNNLAMCLLRLNRGGADLERALQLAAEAVRTYEHHGFYDTQGWVALQAGRTAEAAAAFRKAIQLAAGGEKPDKPVSALIGLATALAGGTTEERAEASRLLTGVEPGALGDEDARRLKRAKELLGS